MNINRTSQGHRLIDVVEENEVESCVVAPLPITVGPYCTFIGELSDDVLGLWVRKEHKDCNDTVRAYLESWVRSGSKYKADRFLEKQVLTFNTYGEMPVGFPVNWLLGSDGKANLSWQLHSFFFVKDFVASHQITKDDYYLSVVDSLIASWIECALVEKPEPQFAWNDHSTANRLLAISQYFAYLQDTLSGDFCRLARLYRLIVRHQVVLLSSSIYTRGTNHGLDQAFNLYLSTIISPGHSSSKKIHDTALDRLRHELMRSFAKDGVHIENSPEYHDLILNSQGVMIQLVSASEGPLPEIEELLLRLNKGISFLAYVLRPDGLFPVIGDTTQIKPRSNHERFSGVAAYPSFVFAKSQGVEGCEVLPDSAVFPVSGYAIMRGKRTLSYSDRLHLVFKCGFLSTYHRHDDDNSFVLYAAGEDWFVDAGVYLYEERDPLRIYMRSAQAHNIFTPASLNVSRNLANVESKILNHAVTSEYFEVTGETTMFSGYRYRRTLSSDCENSIKLRDSCGLINQPEASGGYFNLLLHVPWNKRIEIDKKRIRIFSSTAERYLDVYFDLSGLTDISIIKATEGVPLGWRSIAYSKLEAAQTVVLCYFASNSKTINTTIDIAPLMRDIEYASDSAI